MNIYKNGDFYYLQFKYNGSWISKSLKVKTKSEAKQKTRELLLVDLREYFGLEREKDNTLRTLLGEYLKYSEINKSERTQKDDREVTKRFYKYLGNMDINSIQAAEIQGYINHRKAKSGIGQSRTRIELSVIRAMFNYGRKIGLVHHYPFEFITVGSSKRRIEYLDKGQINKFLNAVCDPVDKDYFTVLLMTGWRCGEFYNLKNENINENHVVLNGKQGKRIYPLLEKAYTKILPIDLKSLIQRLKENGNDYFYTINNSHPSDSYLPHKFKKFVEAANLPSNYSPYTLRHTFATQLLLAGVNILAVSKLMGHSSIQTTQIYEHIAVGNIEALL